MLMWQVQVPTGCWGLQACPVRPPSKICLWPELVCTARPVTEPHLAAFVKKKISLAFIIIRIQLGSGGWFSVTVCDEEQSAAVRHKRHQLVGGLGRTNIRNTCGHFGTSVCHTIKARPSLPCFRSDVVCSRLVLSSPRAWGCWGLQACLVRHPSKICRWPEQVCTARPVTERHLAAFDEKNIASFHHLSNPVEIGQVVVCHRLC